MARKKLTPADSPYTVSFGQGSEAYGASTFYLDVSGTVTVLLPAISQLPSTRNQAIVLTLLSVDTDVTVTPANVDAIAIAVDKGVSASVSGDKGIGGLKLEPSTDHVWSSYISQGLNK